MSKVGVTVCVNLRFEFDADKTSLGDFLNRVEQLSLLSPAELFEEMSKESDETDGKWWESYLDEPCIVNGSKEEYVGGNYVDAYNKAKCKPATV